MEALGNALTRWGDILFGLTLSLGVFAAIDYARGWPLSTAIAALLHR